MKIYKAFGAKYPLLYLFVIVSVSVMLRLYHADQKEVYQTDEISNIRVINATWLDPKEEDQIFKNKWKTGKEYTDYYLTIHKDNLIKDIKFLLWNTNDSPHPNLYYILLRLAFYNGLRGIDGNFKLHGIGLNIIFYCIGAYFLYLLYINIYESKKIAIFAVFIYSISLGAISSSLFIRAYEVLSTLIIITTFLAFRLIDKRDPSLFDYFLLFIALTLSFLTHYLYIIFIILLTFVILFHYLKRKELTYFVRFNTTTILSFITAQAIYPPFIRNIFNSWMSEKTFSKIDFTYLLSHFGRKIRVTYELITHNIIYFIIPITLFIVLLCIYHIKKRNKELLNLKEIYLFIISYSFSIVAIYLSPYELARYIFGIFALLIVTPINFVRLLPLKSLKYLAATFLCVLYIYYNFSSSCINNADLGRFANPPDHKNINRLIFRNNPATPVLFFSSKDWMRHNVIAYFNEDQKYKLLTDKEPILDFYETGSKELFLIIEEGNREEILKAQIKKSKWSIKFDVRYRYYRILYINNII